MAASGEWIGLYIPMRACRSITFHPLYYNTVEIFTLAMHSYINDAPKTNILMNTYCQLFSVVV